MTPGSGRAALVAALALASASVGAGAAWWSGRALARRHVRGEQGATMGAYLVRQLGAGLALAALALVGFGLGAGVLHAAGATVALDRVLDDWLHVRAGPGGVRAMKWVSAVGGSTGMGVLCAGGVIVLARRERSLAWVWGLAYAGVAALDVGLKHLFRRARPVFPNPFVHIGTYSFPSGHSMGSVLGFGMLAYALSRVVRRRATRAVCVALCALGALAVGYSRMYLGAHFYSDVLGGYVTGSVWLAACVSAGEALRRG
jgi:undecaprenyl-diphosphatase